MTRPIFPMPGMPNMGMNMNMLNPNMPINPMFPQMMNPGVFMPNIPITPLATQANIMNLLNKTNLPASGEYKKVYVGKIPPGLSDTFMIKLLETCGNVANWKRGTDHNGRSRGFGFCEYHSVESMLKCLRLLNHLKLEEGYELSIKVDSKTEDFLKQWREQKKQEWIDYLKRKGTEINMEDIKKKEMNGEPLEWELKLINKDHETRKLIFDILTQKNEIEMYAKATERPDDYLKDIKDLTLNPFSIINQHNESEREKERIKRKQANRKKMEKQYIDEEKRWEKREEEKEKERQKNKLSEEDLQKRKKRLIDKDLNFNSDEEERKNKENPKRIEEIKQLRLKEKEFDEMMRRKENPNLYQQEEVINKEVTDLVLIENNEIYDKEPEAKAMVTYQEYIDDDNDNQIFEKPKLKLNIEKKSLISRENIIDEDEPLYDPYNINKTIPQLDIDEETEKVILEISKEVNLSRKEEEKRKLQQQHLKNVISSNGTSYDTSKKIIELQKQIYESIPQNKDDLFKFAINWNLLIKNDILDSKIKPWLSRKMKEYLGEDEPNLIAYILKRLANKASPQEIMEKIKVVFEEDTEEFVKKLWSSLIFEILKVEKLQSYS